MCGVKIQPGPRHHALTNRRRDSTGNNNGYSIKDLEKAGRTINEHFERRAEQRGEAFANRVLERTAGGTRVVVYPALAGLDDGLAASGVSLNTILENVFSVAEPNLWIFLGGGLLGAVGWYKWEYTIRHPFLSSMLGIFGPWIAVAAVMNLAGN